VGKAAIFLPFAVRYVRMVQITKRGHDMKTGFIAAAGLATALLLTGCGKKDDVQGKTGADITAKSSADDIGEAYINELTRIANALDTVDDEASAKKAAGDIREAVEGLNAMSESIDTENMSPVKAMQIFGGRYTELIEVQGRLTTKMIDLQTEHPELMEIVSQEMEKLEN